MSQSVIHNRATRMYSNAHKVRSKQPMFPRETKSPHGGFQPSVTPWTRTSPVSLFKASACFAVTLLSPLFILMYAYALDHCSGNILEASQKLWHAPTSLFNWTSVPDARMIVVFCGWIAFQALLYLILPGTSVKGELTPSGQRFTYRINGLLACLASVTIAAGAVWRDTLSATWIADHWTQLLMMGNVYGFVLAVFCFVKALTLPTSKSDCVFSGKPQSDR